MATDATFVNAAKNSNKETAMQQCASSLMMIVAQMLSENTEFCRNYLDNPDFMNFINSRVFETVYKSLTSKLRHVEDDKEVRNLIFDLLHMDREMSDLSIQEEVIKKFGERYGGMTLNGWRHVIEEYTSIIRTNVKNYVSEEKARTVPIGYPMAAEDDSQIP